MDIEPTLSVLNEKCPAWLLVADGAGHLDPVPISSLRRKPQKALDGLRGNGKRIGGSRFLNHQIRRARHQQPEAKQLPLAIKEGGTNPARPDDAIHEFLSLRHGQLLCVDRESFAPRYHLDQVVLGLLLKAHSTNNGDDLHKLAVLVTADQLLDINRFGGGEFPLAQNLDLGDHDDRGVLARTGDALDLNHLPSGDRWQVRRLQVYARRFILNKPGIEVLVKKAHHASNMHRHLPSRLLGRQASHLVSGAQILPRRGQVRRWSLLHAEAQYKGQHNQMAARPG